MFSFISINWRGRPLVSHQVIVQLIASTKSETGLTIACDIDWSRYPKGIKIPKAASGTSTSGMTTSMATGTTPSSLAHIGGLKSHPYNNEAFILSQALSMSCTADTLRSARRVAQKAYCSHFGCNTPCPPATRDGGQGATGSHLWRAPWQAPRSGGEPGIHRIAAGLTLHPTKTRLIDERDDGFDFLGYHFEAGKCWPRAKSRNKFRDTIRAKTSSDRTRPTSSPTLTARWGAGGLV
jgi:hypothetical protein